MDIAQGNFGEKVSYEVDVLDGKLVLKSEIDLLAFLEKAGDWIKVKIPGEYDDAIINGFIALAKAALEKPEEV